MTFCQQRCSFDVVKTKLQTNPNQYKNLIDGVVSISKEENGMKTFLLGSQATIVGYFWYGLSVYPTYSFSKWYFEHVVFELFQKYKKISSPSHIFQISRGQTSSIVNSF